MTAVAEDLNIDLEIAYLKHRRDQPTLIQELALDNPVKPDYLLLLGGDLHMPTRETFAKLEKQNIQVFLFNGGLSESQFEHYGRPREKLKNWIGMIAPDERLAGELLIQELADAALQQAPSDQTIEIIGIAGNESDPNANRRYWGLHEWVGKHPRFKLDQVVYSKFDQDIAGEQMRALSTRYPNLSIVWAASDHTAMAAANVIKAAGDKQKKIWVGGVDWTPSGLVCVKKGLLEASVGGHFMEGGWALIMLYDHAHGVDFANSEGVVMMSQMSVINGRNVLELAPVIKNGNWGDIDFMAFSKFQYPEKQHYDFDALALLNALANERPDFDK